jgi:predicted hydrocarbon binding protein
MTEIAAPAAPTLRGNYYSSREYLSTDVKTGVTRNRAGTRMICLTRDFLLGLRTALVTECGPAADTVFKTCGRTWGGQFARRFEKELSEYYGMSLSDFALGMFQACLAEAFGRHGWGRLTVDFSRHEQGLIVADLEGAVYAELVETADRPVESLTAGILAGVFSHLSGQDLDCVQTACKACGAPSSRFVLGLKARIEPAEAMVAAGKGHDEIVAALAASRA